MQKYETPAMELIGFEAKEQVAAETHPEADFGSTISKPINPQEPKHNPRPFKWTGVILRYRSN